MSARVQLRILHGAHFACHFFLLIFPTAAIAIAAEAGGGYAAALALGTPLYAAFALATLPAGWLADRLDGGLLIAVFFLGCGAASLLAGLAPGETALMAALALLGLFAALYHPVGLALLTRLAERPGRTLAVNGVFGNLGLAGAALVTGVTADLAGWRAAFALPGLVALAAGAASLAALRRMPASGRAARPLPHAAPAVPGAARRVVAVVLAAALFSGLVFNGVSISLPKLFDERLAAIAPALSGIGGYTAAVFAVAAFAQLPVGAALDRIGGRPLMIGIYLAAAAALALLAGAAGWPALPAALAAVTLMFAGIPISGWLVARHVPQAWRGRAFAFEYVLALGASALVVPAMAALHGLGFGFTWQYLILAAAAAMVALAGLLLPRPARPPRPRPAPRAG